MDENRDLLDQIRESGREMEIPDTLKPETIRKRIMEEQCRNQEKAAEQKEDSGKKKKGFFKRRGFAAAAAAVAVCVLAAGGTAYWKSSEGDRKAAVEKSYESAAAEKTGEAAEEDREKEAAVLPHAKTYRELYNKIYEDYFQTSGTVTSERMPVQNSAQVLESASGMETAESVAVDRAADTASYSSTNTREERVDEGDVVKTDGKYLYVLNQNKGIGIFRKDGTELEKVTWIEPETVDDEIEEFYVTGDELQLIVVRDNTEMIQDEENGAEWTTYYVRNNRNTQVLTYNISDREKPELKGSYSQDGYYLTSRKNGEYLYLFTSYSPDQKEITAEESTFVPRTGEGFIPCDGIFYPFPPRTYGGLNYLVMSSVSSEEPEKAVDQKALISDVQLFYVSEEHIYVTYEEWDQEEDQTRLVSFSYKEGKIRPAGAGSVPGCLNDSFSLDEYDGYLRLVASQWDYDKGERTNNLYVVDGELNRVGSISGLAEGEDIQSARFLGEKAYFVTYRNTDPLFSVDLSEPSQPKILGELEITGFSEYLHFYGEDLLLGLGWETDPETGERLGLKLSMFDIADPSQVKECDRVVLENVQICTGTWEYKAVLADPEKNLIGFSFTEEGGETFYVVFSYEAGTGFTKKMADSLGDLAGDLYTVRGLFAEDCYYVTADQGIAVYDMENEFKKTEKLSWY